MVLSLPDQTLSWCRERVSETESWSLAKRTGIGPRPGASRLMSVSVSNESRWIVALSSADSCGEARRNLAPAGSPCRINLMSPLVVAWTAHLTEAPRDVSLVLASVSFSRNSVLRTSSPSGANTRTFSFPTRVSKSSHLEAMLFGLMSTSSPLISQTSLKPSSSGVSYRSLDQIVAVMRAQSTANRNPSPAWPAPSTCRSSVSLGMFTTGWGFRKVRYSKADRTAHGQTDLKGQ
jgi:hypothetical protein